MPRLHLFELNDSAWAPRQLRDTLVESLSLALERGRVLRDAVEPFAEFLTACGAREVLDLCSGAGRPAAIFCRELQRQGLESPRFVLTDLFPQVETWRALEAELPSHIGYVAQPIDATRVPAMLGAGRPRLIVNALHHFRPEQAEALLASAAEDAPGLFIVEGITRNPLRFAALAPYALPALLAAPLRAKSGFATRAALTWLSPAALAASVWDGTVSALRSYGEDELRAMVTPLGKRWCWRSGELSFGGFGRGTWFAGVRS